MLDVVKRVAQAATVPFTVGGGISDVAQIVASGGAGKREHFYEAVEAGATILLAASVFHFRMFTIPELKEYPTEGTPYHSPFSNSIPLPVPRLREYCFFSGLFQCSWTPRLWSVAPSPSGS